MAAKLPTNEHLKSRNYVLQMKFLNRTNSAISPKPELAVRLRLYETGFPGFQGNQSVNTLRVKLSAVR